MDIALRADLTADDGVYQLRGILLQLHWRTGHHVVGEKAGSFLEALQIRNQLFCMHLRGLSKTIAVLVGKQLVFHQIRYKKEGAGELRNRVDNRADDCGKLRMPVCEAEGRYLFHHPPGEIQKLWLPVLRRGQPGKAGQHYQLTVQRKCIVDPGVVDLHHKLLQVQQKFHMRKVRTAISGAEGRKYKAAVA